MTSQVLSIAELFLFMSFMMPDELCQTTEGMCHKMTGFVGRSLHDIGRQTVTHLLELKRTYLNVSWKSIGETA